MYVDHMTLVKAIEEETVSTKDVFNLMNQMGRSERKKFINKAKWHLRIK
jgi:hypothetical protein